MIPPELDDLPFNRVQRLILNLLSTRGEVGASSYDLMDCLYAHDSEGGPLSAYENVRSQVSRVRRLLLNSGWCIPQVNERDGSGRYVLRRGNQIRYLRKDPDGRGVSLSMWVDEAVRRRLATLAEAEGRPVSHVARDLLMKGLEDAAQ